MSVKRQTLVQQALRLGNRLLRHPDDTLRLPLHIR
jgi:hypothetical protein